MCRKKQSRRRLNLKRKNRRNIKRSCSPPTRNKEQLAGLFDWFLGGDPIFSKLKLHGNISWAPERLVCLALLWAWSESRHVTDAYDDAVACYRKMFDSVVPGTYQGFMGALTRWTPGLMNILWPVLHQRMEEIGGPCWQVGLWVPIAFDGSRSTAPRSKANEKAFCAGNYGKGATAKYRKKKSKGMRRKKNERNKAHAQEPQAWITMLWHMGLRLPWMWRLGPSNSSERAHVMEMLQAASFPPESLFCGDAGFVGYPLWSAILAGGYHFLVRVGANVRLLRASADCKFLKNGIVLCWPKAAQANRPPLRLRLIKVRIGKTDVHLLTSVLDRSQLTIQQMVKLYKLRWGIELEFRGLKQTLDRAKLRCRNDQRLLAELDWSIMAMAVAELLALKEQLGNRSLRQHQHPPDPGKRSLAMTMRAIRNSLRKPNETPEPGKDLKSMLGTAVTDRYQRKASKRARYHPPNPDKKPLGEPKVSKLTAQQQMRLDHIEQQLAA